VVCRSVQLERKNSVCGRNGSDRRINTTKRTLGTADDANQGPGGGADPRSTTEDRARSPADRLERQGSGSDRPSWPSAQLGAEVLSGRLRSTISFRSSARRTTHAWARSGATPRGGRGRIHSFIDAQVGQGKTYTYKIVALAKVGEDAVVACRTETGRITTPEPPKPTQAPATAGFGLTVSIVEGKVLVDWSACGAAGFDYYKVVRSKDAMVTFPAGDYDALIAAVGPDGETASQDKTSPVG
jgi:hypothetical protein